MPATVNAAIEPSCVVASFAVPGSQAVSVGPRGVVLHAGRSRRSRRPPLLERVADRAGRFLRATGEARADAGRVATLNVTIASPAQPSAIAERGDRIRPSPQASDRARRARTRRAFLSPASPSARAGVATTARLLPSTSVEGVRNAESACGGCRNRPSIASSPLVACTTSSISGPSVYGLWNKTESESGTPCRARLRERLI